MLQDTGNLLIHWYHLSDKGLLQLSEYDNLTSLTILEEGVYEVNLINEKGCIVAKKEVEVVQSINQAPVLKDVYTICMSENYTATITPEKEFEYYFWMKKEEGVSVSSIFIASEPGSYTLVANDKSGCGFSYDFEVVDSFTPLLRFPIAIRTGDPKKEFKVHVNSLIDELEVFIQKRTCLFHQAPLIEPTK